MMVKAATLRTSFELGGTSTVLEGAGDLYWRDFRRIQGKRTGISLVVLEGSLPSFS